MRSSRRKIHSASMQVDSNETACGRRLDCHILDRLFQNGDCRIEVADPRFGDVDVSCEKCLNILGL